MPDKGSNVCIQYLRGRNVLIRQRLAAKPVQEIRLCTVVLAELYVGVLRSSNAAADRASVDTFAALYVCLPFDQVAADEYARIRHHLEMLGMPIGPDDLQIAAIALANGCTLMTHNTAEFSRVPGLLLEDWESP